MELLQEPVLEQESEPPSPAPEIAAKVLSLAEPSERSPAGLSVPGTSAATIAAPVMVLRPADMDMDTGITVGPVMARLRAMAIVIKTRS